MEHFCGILLYICYAVKKNQNVVVSMCWCKKIVVKYCCVGVVVWKYKSIAIFCQYFYIGQKTIDILWCINGFLLYHCVVGINMCQNKFIGVVVYLLEKNNYIVVFLGHFWSQKNLLGFVGSWKKMSISGSLLLFIKQ